MKTNFKVGDPVWDAIIATNKEGVVIPVTSGSQQVRVRFGEVDEMTYTSDGRWRHDFLPTLSKVPYTFKLPEQPVEFKEGDPVLVRDDDEHVWIGSRYKRKGSSDDYPYETFIGSTSVSWKQCIPFDIDKLGRV